MRISDGSADVCSCDLLSSELAVNLLKFSDKKAANLIKKVVESAIANAENNQGADVDELTVKTIMVDEGPTLKRFMARAKGRGTRILKIGLASCREGVVNNVKISVVEGALKKKIKVQISSN